MRFWCISILCFLLLGVDVFAQQLSDADSYFDAKDYCRAKTMYASILKNKPLDAVLNFKYGVCLYSIGDYPQAYKAFEMAAKKIPQANVFLGDISFKNYYFQEALTYYNQAMLSLPATEPDAVACTVKIEKATKALNMLSSVEEIRIMDSLVVDKKDFFKHYQLSEDAGKIYESGKAVSADSLPLSGFMTERKDRRFITDTIANNTDIFLSNRLLDGWNEKQALSSVVNTSANENFPFLSADGVTLYFCSDGSGSLGGYDIFVSRFRSDTNDFLAPENVGMPFNSPYNDYLMAIDEEQNTGWFASDRYQASGKVIVYKFRTNNTRVTVQTQDEEQKIKYAQLKQYKLYVPEADTLAPKTASLSSSISVKDTMNFVVNDTLIYHSVNDFKSLEAKAQYQKGMEQEQQLGQMKQQIVQKRTDFGQAKAEEEKTTLMPQIVGLEQDISNLEQEMNSSFKAARNLEIKKIDELNQLPSRYDF